MRVLIACEQSGKIRDQFLSLGHSAYSCDLLPNNHPNHIQDDVRNVIKENTWDLMIAHPPCTYLSNAGNGAFSPGRFEKTEEAIELFKFLYSAPVFHICIENPAGYMNTHFRIPQQIIHPYYFGDPALKRTCLWLKNLPNLRETNRLKKPEPTGIYKSGDKKGKPYHWTNGVGGIDRDKIRSTTFDGIAKAMANQWGNLKDTYIPRCIVTGAPVEYQYLG